MSIRVNKGKFKINALAKAVLTFIPPTPTPTTTPTTTPTATVGTSPTPTASLTASPTLTQTPTVTPTPSITASQTVTPSNTVTATQTQTPSNTATQTQTPTPSITASQTVTPSNTTTATQTPTPSITASQTPTQGSTPTPTITQTQTPTPSITASQTPTTTTTLTATQTQTQTQTPTPSITASQTPTTTTTLTATQTPTTTTTLTATQTPTTTTTLTATQTPTTTTTLTATQTPTTTTTLTATQTPTTTTTLTATQTPTTTTTLTATQTPTTTTTLTASQTQTPTTTLTASQTQTPTQTPTTTTTLTASQTQTPTQTPTTTTTLTASQTQTPTQTPTTTTTLTASQTKTPTQTPTTTTTLTASQTQTPTQTPTTTTTLTASQTKTPTQTPTTTTTLTASQTQTPTQTPTTTTTLTASQTQTPTNTPTNTSTPTNTPTFTPTPTNTPLLSCATCSGTGWEPYSSTQCVRISTGPATAPAFTVSLVSAAFTDYSDFGTRFYGTGFNYDGTGTILQTNTTNVVWKKTFGLLDGPLNRSGKSGSTIQNFIWYGFSACVTGITTSQTYYVGIGADNEYRLVLDGQEILNTYTPSTSGNTNHFRYWNVYPVQLDAGNHSLELYGMNDPGAGLNPHSFGMEIYNNTLSQLTAATSVNSLNIIYSSSGRTTAEIVQNNSGYYLSSGYTCNYPAVYSVCSGNCVTYEYCYAPGITPTPTHSATPTPTPPVTPTQTPTTSPIPCECWTVVNEDTVTINYSVTNCNGTVTSPNLLPGARFNHCLQGGTFPTVNSPIGGLLGEYECGTTCTQGGGQCSDCGPAPTPTQTSTQTPTPTQTPTSTSVPSQYVFVSNTGSLDVSITDVKINGVSVTYDTGQNFPIDPSDSGQFITYQLGTYDIDVYYGTSISGQHIDVTDSNSTLTCGNTGAPVSNTFTVTGAVINGTTAVYIDALDGSC